MRAPYAQRDKLRMPTDRSADSISGHEVSWWALYSASCGRRGGARARGDGGQPARGGQQARDTPGDRPQKAGTDGRQATKVLARSSHASAPASNAQPRRSSGKRIGRQKAGWVGASPCAGQRPSTYHAGLDVQCHGHPHGALGGGGGSHRGRRGRLPGMREDRREEWTCTTQTSRATRNGAVGDP